MQSSRSGECIKHIERKAIEVPWVGNKKIIGTITMDTENEDGIPGKKTR